jgi:hypothetical protein
LRRVARKVDKSIKKLKKSEKKVKIWSKATSRTLAGLRGPFGLKKAKQHIHT